jgi:hypothetical protein
MPILRVSKKQIQEAMKAREAALAKHREFRLHDEQRRQSLDQAPVTQKPEPPR